MTVPVPAGPPSFTAPSGPVGPSAPGGPAVPIGPWAPQPPAGPGAVPPFAAPPTEGRTHRLWLGIGAAALGVLFFCGGGGTLLVGLAVAGMQAVEEQARATVNDYFDAVLEGRYAEAYGLLCDEVQQRESRREFERRVRAEPQIDDYEVGEVRLAEEIHVPVDVTYVSGGSEALDVRLVQDSTTGRMEVCGIK
jgi:hypothetical protein